MEKLFMLHLNVNLALTLKDVGCSYKIVLQVINCEREFKYIAS